MRLQERIRSRYVCILMLAATCASAVPALADGITIDCSKCTASMSQYYYRNLSKSGSFDQHLGELTQCFQETAQSLIVVDPEEVRNYFEATGKLLQSSDLDLMDHEGEKELLEKTAKAGRWKYAWLIGARDCLTHAQKLKAYLEATLPKGDFAIEVVNTWPDVAPDADAANPLPGANHYVVRVVGLKTGKSYIVDGYLGVSVEEEWLVEKMHQRIVMNDFESCFFDQVIEKKTGYSASGTIPGAVLSNVPGYRTIIARDAKAAAQQCENGAKEAHLQ